MSGQVVVVHASEDPPDEWDASIFLAGPTPRSSERTSWRPAAIELLRTGWHQPGRLVVFVPEPRESGAWPEYDAQRTWELYWGDRCDVVLFWIPRGPGMIGLTTNDEWGRWKDSGRVVLGTPPDAEHVRYQREYGRSAAQRSPTRSWRPSTMHSRTSGPARTGTAVIAMLRCCCGAHRRFANGVTGRSMRATGSCLVASSGPCA